MDLTEQAFDCLRRAVNLARERQIRSVNTLVELLKRDGYSLETITEAIMHWSSYEKRKAA